MPPLKNPRHERFAQELAKGVPAIHAYEQAGYKPNHGNAGELNRSEQIQARVRELMNGVAKRLEVSKARVLQEYARIAFADKLSLMEKYESGATLTDDERGAFDFEIVPTKEGPATKIKMESKTAALEALARHLRLFEDRASGGGLTIVFEEGSKRQVREINPREQAKAREASGKTIRIIAEES